MIFWEKKKKDSFLLILLSVLIILVVALLLVVSWFTFDVYRNQDGEWLKKAGGKELKGDNISLDLSNKDPEVGGVVEKVSQHILLPANQFTVATVKDAPSLIKENPILYQYLRNGQKVLLYDTGVIIYDQELDKVVDVVQFYPARQEKLIKANK